MDYQSLRFRLTGASPLLMHNGQLADPLNRFAKARQKVAVKRAKTEADHQEIARIEFLGGLYVGSNGPCIPGSLIEAAMVEAARKSKRGQVAKAGLISEGNFDLLYDGPRDPEGLWDDGRFRFSVSVKVQRNRVMRTRPIFRDWACEISLDYLSGQLSRDDVEEMVRTAGQIVGLGDWRPKFGRFSAAVT